MAQLWNKTKNSLIAESTVLAASHHDKIKGLLGRKTIDSNEALIIPLRTLDFGMVHTFFMNFPIDLVFLDRSMKATSFVKNLNPWRLNWPRIGARTVIELKAGKIVPETIELGDEVYVDS